MSFTCFEYCLESFAANNCIDSHLNNNNFTSVSFIKGAWHLVQITSTCTSPIKKGQCMNFGETTGSPSMALLLIQSITLVARGDSK